MTFNFIMTSEVTAQGPRFQVVCAWTFFFFCSIFLQIFPPFLSLSLSSYFPFYRAFISYSCFGLAYSLRQAGLLKKDKVKVDFQNLIFQVFSTFESFWCPPSM